MVLRRCRRLLGDEELAADAMQDVFVAVLRRASALDEQHPSSLLYRTATNVCLNRIRTSRRKPAVPDGDAILEIALLPDALERSLGSRVLAALRGSQPESSLVMAALLYLDGLTLEEVAAETGMSVSGVRKRMRQLRAHLRHREGLHPEAFDDATND